MLCIDCKSAYDKAWRKGLTKTEYHWSGRFTLKQDPKKYKRIVKCPRCKGDRLRDVEQQRQKEVRDQDTCNCDFIPFPHKRGTVLGCDHHPKPYDEWTREDEEQIQAMLETPRSG